MGIKETLKKKGLRLPHGYETVKRKVKKIVRKARRKATRQTKRR